MAEVMYTFPQAFLILLIAFQGSDYRLYEASNMLGASKTKQFFTVTLPSVKYGLIVRCSLCLHSASLILAHQNCWWAI